MILATKMTWCVCVSRLSTWRRVSHLLLLFHCRSHSLSHSVNVERVISQYVFFCWFVYRGDRRGRPGDRYGDSMVSGRESSTVGFVCCLIAAFIKAESHFHTLVLFLALPLVFGAR